MFNKFKWNSFRNGGIDGDGCNSSISPNILLFNALHKRNNKVFYLAILMNCDVGMLKEIYVYMYMENPKHKMRRLMREITLKKIVT